jgi:hypothetical protein
LEPTAAGRAALVASLEHGLQRCGNSSALTFADDLTIDPSLFRDLAVRAQADGNQRDRALSDWLVCFGCEATTVVGSSNRRVIQDTAFRTMSGAGHQHFLKTMRDLIREATPAHLAKALFEPWRYDDPIQGLSLRWNPADDARYAHQWVDPSKDTTRPRAGSVLGANALALAALPLFPTVPVGARLRTTAVSGHRANDTHFTWPIWESPISVDECRTLLAMAELQESSPPPRALRARGVVTVYRSQRITVGKFRSFTPARAV